MLAAIQVRGPVMAALIALAAICLFAAGVVAGIIGVVAVAVGREERDPALTSQAPDDATCAGRRLTGLYVRAGMAAPAGHAFSGRTVAPADAAPDGARAEYGRVTAQARRPLTRRWRAARGRSARSR